LRKNRFVLLPLAFLYQLITSLRNLLFDFGIFKSEIIEIPSIGIGNLSLGGTGKTPISAYFMEKYANFYIAYVSRGYGRKSKGLYIIKPENTIELTGDEAFMLYKRFPLRRFVLAEKRILAYNYLLGKKNKPNLIIFDDVYQHRYIQPAVNILLCDFENPFYLDFLAPYGRLRERRVGAKRADLIIVTKSPKDINYSEKTAIIEEIHKYSEKNTPVFFSFFKTHAPINAQKESLSEKTKVILVSAIANNESFRNVISKKYLVKHHYEHRDHHFYTAFQINKIKKAYPGIPIVCTEKDYYKIIGFFSESEQHLVYFAPLSVQIDEEEKLFDFLKNHNIPKIP
jgi:tetraacyldisaccharide 4'-kinase